MNYEAKTAADGAMRQLEQGNRDGTRAVFVGVDQWQLTLPAALWPWVDSASNRNEYQESSWR
jgi:hypothetical protein